MSGSLDTPNQFQEAKKLWLPRSATGSGSSGAGRGRRRSEDWEGGAGRSSHTGAWRGGKRSEMLLKSGPRILQPNTSSLPTPTPSLRKRPVGFKPHLPPPPPLPHLEGVGTHKENVKNSGASNECVPKTQRLASALPTQTQEIRPQPSPLRPRVQDDSLPSSKYNRGAFPVATRGLLRAVSEHLTPTPPPKWGWTVA